MKSKSSFSKTYPVIRNSILQFILVIFLISLNGCQQIKQKGFSVETYNLVRPFWEIFADDLDGDGKPEIIASDVDGIVTVRNMENKVLLSYNAGALVYQFEAADLNNDGIREIIMSSLDPKIPVKAIDLQGNTIQIFNESSGPERLAAADMNKDGNFELAVSINNLKGTAAGVLLYDNKGKTLWVKKETLREFHIADIVPGGDLELVTGGPRTNFRVYDIEGIILDTINVKRDRLDHFSLSDIDKDGKTDIVASHEPGSRSPVTEILCVSNGKIIWDIPCPSQLKEHCWDFSAAQTMLACADFDKKTDGIETILIGSNYLFMYDSKGILLYQNREGYEEYWESYAPDGINPMDIALWNSKVPQLFISSPRYRDKAWYSLTYGKEDEYRTYLIPDLERHLDTIYQNIKEQPVQVYNGDQKIKIFMEMHPLLKKEFVTAPEETILKYREMLDSMESSHLEYLVLWEICDIQSQKSIRGDYLPADQIIERARMFEKAGIPFGYWVGHGSRVWLSDETIRESKKAAPEMFRFLCVVENLENFYTPGYKKWLAWVNKTLDFCAENEMKMIFKDKHDIWGLIPADKEIADILFNPKFKDVIVPAFSTNQPYHFEIQLGGLLGLKMAGLCNEFGISSQFWNWHEWGGYPFGIRDITPALVCPNDIILRLDLLGIALGATWINLEHGQPYFLEDISKGLCPLAYRHREINFELIRKNIIKPGLAPVNISQAAVVRSMHPEIMKAKEKGTGIFYPYYTRNTEELRKGFIPARYMFEPYPPHSFPMLAYSSAWNAITCFPQTPNGWIPVVPPQAKLPGVHFAINTDGEKILMDNQWKDIEESASYVEKTIKEGADEIIIEAPGTCLILQKDDSEEGIYTAILIDPGYLAPKGVETTLISNKGNIVKATDLVTGEAIKISGNSCTVNIQPGAFRVIKLELNEKL